MNSKRQERLRRICQLAWIGEPWLREQYPTFEAYVEATAPSLAKEPAPTPRPVPTPPAVVGVKESNEPAQRLAQERRAKPPVGPRRRSGFQADTPLDRARALALRWRALNEVGERELRQRPAAYQPAVGEDATRPPIEPAAKDAKQNKAIQEYMAAHAGTDYKTAALAVARTRRDLF